MCTASETKSWRSVKDRACLILFVSAGFLPCGSAIANGSDTQGDIPRPLTFSSFTPCTNARMYHLLSRPIAQIETHCSRAPVASGRAVIGDIQLMIHLACESVFYKFSVPLKNTSPEHDLRSREKPHGAFYPFTVGGFRRFPTYRFNREVLSTNSFADSRIQISPYHYL